MENFEFVSPTHFVFGKGAEEQVGSKLAECGARTVLLHFGGQSAVKSGLIDRVKASLDAQGIKHVELGGVRPNPEITLAREGIALCKEHDVDWVLAVGGGSVIDSAKAIAVGAHYDGDVWDFFETKRPTDDVLPIAVVLGVWAVAFGALRLRDALRRRASGQPWGCCAGDAAVKFAVGIFMLASPLGSMAAWTVMVGLFFLFVGASVIFSAVYLDRLPHDFEDF